MRAKGASVQLSWRVEGRSTAYSRAQLDLLYSLPFHLLFAWQHLPNLAMLPPPPSNTAGLCFFCQDSPIARGKSKELETPVQGAKIQSPEVAQQPAQSQCLQL